VVQAVRPSTVELSLEFLETDTEEEDSEEDEEAKQDHERGSDIEMHDADIPLEEAAVAVQRTYSEISADTMSFLKAFILKHNIRKWKTDPYENILVAEALESNPGGDSTKDLIKQIKAILAQPAPDL
jgi:hypothetical protein